MSEETPIQVDELSELKARADKIGVKYHPNISADKLRERVNAKLKGEQVVEDEEEVPAAPAEEKKETLGQMRKRLKKEATRLVRCRITCMNPNKREWPGEYISFSNKYVPTIKRYVPFNLEDPWHVEEAILKQLQARKCQIFVPTVDERGNRGRKGKQIKEFAIEILPQLTQEELDELARRQALGNNID